MAHRDGELADVTPTGAKQTHPSPLWIFILVGTGLQIACHEDPRSFQDDLPPFAELTPVLTIGAATGPESHNLYRVTAATRRPDGSILIANSGTSEIRLFSAAGDLVRIFGRAGDGPGEFRAINTVGVCGTDTIYGYDRWQRRLTFFALDGTILKTLQLEPLHVPQEPQFAYALPGGGALGVVHGGARPGHPRERAGLVRGTAVAVRYHPDGRIADTILALPGSEGLYPRRRVGGYSVDPPFGRDVFHNLRGQTLIMGNNDRFAFRLVDVPTGDMVELAYPEAETPLDPAEIAEVARTITRIGPYEAEEVMDPTAIPSLRPAYGALVLDELGYIWVGPYQSRARRSTMWRVFTPTAGYVGPVTLPLAMWILAVDREFVIGLSVDDLDVERVHVLKLTRRPGGEQSPGEFVRRWPQSLDSHCS